MDSGSLAAIAALLGLQAFWIKHSLDALGQRITELGQHLGARLDELTAGATSSWRRCARRTSSSPRGGRSPSSEVHAMAGSWVVNNVAFMWAALGPEGQEAWRAEQPDFVARALRAALGAYAKRGAGGAGSRGWRR